VRGWGEGGRGTRRVVVRRGRGGKGEVKATVQGEGEWRGPAP
jgi:hypothetical protein